MLELNSDRTRKESNFRLNTILEATLMWLIQQQVELFFLFLRTDINLENYGTEEIGAEKKK